MKKAHARPSKRYVCDGCKRRIRWASLVHRVGRHGQLVWCDECWQSKPGPTWEGGRPALEPHLRSGNRLALVVSPRDS